MRVELEHRFPVARGDGFDYITDIDNWPAYWPGLVRIESGSQWKAPGDQARLVIRLLGRDTEMIMTLERIVPDQLVEYVSEQPALPKARHTRHFADDGQGGLAYRLAVAITPRAGLRGIFDRLLLRPAVKRALRTTVKNLDARFGARHGD